MRVISGKYRGKKLNTLDSIETRPTTDRVKENVFNLLPHQFSQNTKVLDLFSGSGAIAIEFASRGAKNIYINEVNKSALDVIKSNIKNIDANFKLFNEDAFAVSKLLNINFDYIYIDGPYNKYDIISLLNNIKTCITSETIIIIETDKNYKNSFDNFEILKEKKYGQTKIWIIRREHE